MTITGGGETYSLPEIQAFYASEQPALHGTSPDVYAQNLALIGRIQSLTDRAEYPIIGVQLLGSRANGSAGVESDADVAVIHLEHFNDRRVWSMDRDVHGALAPLRYDSWGALAMHRIQPNIPTDPDYFVAWAASTPWMSVGLHEQGLYAAPELKICALALTTIMANRPNRRNNWDRIRDVHTAAYITGHIPRTAEKIAERLGLSASTDEILPPALVAERVDRFGLPKTFGTYHEKLQEWAAGNRETVQGSAAYPILEAAEQATST
jgi:hypothetical protein